jgi:hypothetical protein
MKLFLIFLISIFSLNLIAQNNPYGQVSIASPTAASLAKYADIPVNYHTGVPNISIPVYDLKEGSIGLPISLSYFAGGLKVAEPASWVGAGWSLNAGGVITRTVKGAPDERNTSNVYTQEKGYFSDYGFRNYASDANGSEIVNFLGKKFLEGRKDGQPDIFFFNFNGYSGKFYFNDDRTAIVIPGQDVKIEYNYQEGIGSIKSFIITVSNGDKYLFGITTSTTDIDPVEISDPVTSGNGYSTGNVITSWYLNKVISADGVFSISFEYEKEEFGVFSVNTFRQNGIPPDPDGIYCSKNIVHGVRLKKINTSQAIVDFIPGNLRLDLSGVNHDIASDVDTHTANTLGQISITTPNGNCNKIIFDYSYFEDNVTSLSGRIPYNITTDKKRLKLEKITESTCSNSIRKPPYIFQYANETVPRRLSCGQDHWGFANGANTNTGLIPTYTVNKYFEFLGAN